MAPSQSSLLSHSFPAFYACYLLKSVSKKAIYIGSTPSPPRRIRQHNGELSQGARKTLGGRPWVMQMIVHGFPSKLAALQFEWAWQHPGRSRYLRDATGTRRFPRNTRLVGKSIEVVQTMIRTPPFNVWPLHAKLFTEEASDAWHRLAARSEDPPPARFPPGFSWTSELEGVDGCSGHPLGSGRTGPLSVKDEHFTSIVLAKNTAVMAAGPRTCCAVCSEGVDYSAKDALTTALCPHDACLAVSHLICLATRFLPAPGAPEMASSVTRSRLVPRGGECPSCGKYTLWGDIVRGSYRRVIGTAVVPPDEEGRKSDGDLFTSDSECGEADIDATPKGKQATQKRAKARAKSRKNKSDSSAGESDAGSSGSSDSGSTPRATKKSESGIESDSSSVAGPSTLLPQRPGRPPKAPTGSRRAMSSISCPTRTESQARHGIIN